MSVNISSRVFVDSSDNQNVVNPLLKSIQVNTDSYTITSGTTSNNNLTGTAGDDYFDGKGGNDIIDGGDGNDVIFDGAGSGRLTGGTGGDTFQFTATSDSNVITKVSPNRWTENR